MYSVNFSSIFESPCPNDLFKLGDCLPYLLTVILIQHHCVAVQSNNAYIFPGMGLGTTISGAIRVHDDMFLAAGIYSFSPQQVIVS